MLKNLYYLHMDYFNDLKIIRSDLSKIHSGTITREPCNYYCLQYNHKGKINIKLDNSPSVTVDGPSLLITNPKMKFSFGTGNKNTWHHNYIAFTGDRVSSYIKSGFLPIKNPIHLIHDGPKFLNTLNEFQDKSTKGAIGKNRSIHLFESLLLQLHEQSQYKAKETPLINDIQILLGKIQKRPHQNWDFKMISEKLHVSYGHFRRIFTDLTKLAPQNYIIQSRLSKASELLLTKNMPIKEIAERVGIDDIHYFTKIFKRAYHLPPAKYRKEMRT